MRQNNRTTQTSNKTEAVAASVAPDEGKRSPRETVRDRPTDRPPGWAAANNRRLTDSLSRFASFALSRQFESRLSFGLRERHRAREGEMDRERECCAEAESNTSEERVRERQREHKGWHINKQVLLAFVASLIHDFNF